MRATHTQQLIISEPFRILFPLGILFGISSVMLWPMYETGLCAIYPAQMHARILVLGFIGSFVLGFLGTAFPRLVGVSGLRLYQLLVLLICLLSSQVLYFLDQIPAADTISLILWTLVIMTAGTQLQRRTDTPPPGFVLVVTGVFSLWTALLLSVSQQWLHVATSWSYPLSRILMFEAFPTLLVIGVAPYFFPKILGGNNRHEFDETRSPNRAWFGLAARAFVTAGIAMSGFVLKLTDPQWGAMVVSIAVWGYTFIEIPLLPRLPGSRGSMAWGLLLGMVGILLGTTAPALYPSFRIGVFHLLMVGGVSLILMTVSIRVVHGHAGEVIRTLGRQGSMLTIAVLLPVAGLTRLSADVLPATRSSHLIYASLLFVVCAVVWFWKNSAYLLCDETKDGLDSE